MADSKNMKRLKEILGSAADLNAASALLDWDMRTFMPPGAIESRSFQLATLEEAEHEKMTSRELGNLLRKLEHEVEDLDPDSDEYRLVKKVKREYDRDVKTPPRWVRRNAQAVACADTAWGKARAAADFRIFAPHLQKLLDLKLEYVSFFEPAEHPYDILLDRFDEGMTCSVLTRLFSRLKQDQGAIIREALAKEKPENSFLKRKYPASKQLALTRRVLSRMGYDWKCGRQDRSVHPFTTSFGLYDVRITTKVVEGNPFSALFSSIHEGGHALYEQGINKNYARTPFADGASFSVHESQSRLWENLVGRSPEFWNYWFPVVRKMFPGNLDTVSPEEFLAALNTPEASPIRTEADELTYNMHIILRFELEKSLIEGKMKVTELADAWNAGMKELLGIEIRNDVEGVLQDIHWAMGEFGYFPSYALGNVISAQLWDAALKEEPGIPDSIAHGVYAPLREWLRSHVHVFGAKYNTEEILDRATGTSGLDPEPYLNMLKKKYC